MPREYCLCCVSSRSSSSTTQIAEHKETYLGESLLLRNTSTHGVLVRDSRVCASDGIIQRRHDFDPRRARCGVELCVGAYQFEEGLAAYIPLSCPFWEQLRTPSYTISRALLNIQPASCTYFKLNKACSPARAKLESPAGRAL